MALGTLLVAIRASASAWASDVKDIQRDAKSLERSVKPLTTAFADIGKVASVAGLAIVGAFAVAIKSAANYGDEINDASKRTGIATESLSKLRLAAETSGSSFDGLSTGLKLLGKNMELANSGAKAQIQAFKAAGISTADLAAAQGDVNKILPQLADSFKNAEDGAGKTAVAMALLGRSGADLIPMLNEGSAGLAKWGDEAQRAGRVVTAEAAAAADEFNDRLRILQVSVMGLTGSIGNALIPKMTEWITEGTKVIQQVKDWTAANKELANGIGITGLILAGSGGILVSLAALPALLTKVRVAWAALAATIALSTAGLSVALAAVVIFRNEIAMGLVAAFATAVQGMEQFLKFSAELAAKIGLGGIAARLHDASFSAGTFRRELDATVTAMILEGRAAQQASDQLKAQGAAHTQVATTVGKNRIELEKNTAELDKAREAAKKYSEFWSEALQDFRTSGMVSGASDIQAGLDAAKRTSEVIIDLARERKRIEKDIADFWKEQLQDIRTKGMVSGGEDIAVGLKVNDRIADTIIKKHEDMVRVSEQFIQNFRDGAGRVWDTFSDRAITTMQKIARLSSMLFDTISRTLFQNFATGLLTGARGGGGGGLGGAVGSLGAGLGMKVGLGALFGGSAANAGFGASTMLPGMLLPTAIPAIAAPAGVGAGLGGALGLSGGAGLLGLGAATIPVVGGIIAAGIFAYMKLRHRTEEAPFTKDPFADERRRTIFFFTNMTEAMNRFTQAVDQFGTMSPGVLVKNGMPQALASNTFRRDTASIFMDDI